MQSLPLRTAPSKPYLWSEGALGKKAALFSILKGGSTFDGLRSPKVAG